MDRLESMGIEVARLSGQSAGKNAEWSGTRGSGVASSVAEQLSDRARALVDPFDTDDSDSVLTRREIQVLRLMASGATNAQVANLLVISEGTVKTHVKHILRKLDAANRAEAVSRWLRDKASRTRTRNA
jgi:DNA-binding NarL/FixJ family response regulator